MAEPPPRGPIEPAKVRVTLFVVALLLVLIIATPIWRPLMLGAVFAGALSRWHDAVAAKLGGRRNLSSGLFTVAMILAILGPVALTLMLAIGEAFALAASVQSILESQGIKGILGLLPQEVQGFLRERVGPMDQTPRQLMEKLRIWRGAGWAARFAVGFFGSVSRLVFSLILMLIAMYFLLRDGHALVAWIRRSVPGGGAVTSILGTMRHAARSLIAGNVGTGAVQAAVATLGYWISGVPSPWLLGLLTFAATFIPSVGTGLVGFPAAGLLFLMGRPGWAVFLLIWIAFVAGLVDNFLRPYLMRGSQHISPVVLFFALAGGVFLLGAAGLVAGPLAVSFFLAATQVLGHDVD